MRSYDTGTYSILKDGNFQLTMARIIASDFDELIVTLPLRCEDYQQFINQNWSWIKEKNIRFRFLKYGENAVETRKNFWNDNQDYFYSELFREFDLLITDITGYDLYRFGVPYINNFNITKLPELNRPYIDQFFDLDIKSMELALFTTVINPRQRDYVLEVAPHLKDKVYAYYKVAHNKLMPDFYDEIINKVYNELDFFRSEALYQSTEIFWPFRISDAAYKFQEAMDVLVKNNLHTKYKVTITDPNDSFTGEMAKKYPFVNKVKLNKQEYYRKLNEHPIVIMLDDIDTVLHPGTIEFFHYFCQVITFKSNLLPSRFMIESMEDIPQMLEEVVYNPYPGGKHYCHYFVYYGDEVSKHYNKNNINAHKILNL